MLNAQAKNTKLRGLSPRAKYSDRATAACRRSYYQLLRIEGAQYFSENLVSSEIEPGPLDL
jgi:hypothetical protein